MNDMQQFLLELHQNYPEAVEGFLNHLKKQKQTKNRFFIVSILCAFNKHTSTSWEKTFPDVYQRFSDTGFVAKQLNEEDKEYIIARYINEVEKLGRKVIRNAI